MRDEKVTNTSATEKAKGLAAAVGDATSVVVTNPRLDDNPIIYLNDAFERMTGYARSAVIGRNCRFLQGENTDPETVSAIREAVAAREDVTVDILNYRADGSPFWNRLALTPLRDDTGEVAYFIGIQTYRGSGSKPEIDQRQKAIDALGELQHRVKNHLAMIVGMVRLQARAQTAEADFGTLSRRIETLQLLYEEMTDRDDGDADVALGAYVSRIAAAIGHLDGRPGVRIDVQTVACQTSPDRATRIGFLVSEILTNAMQHAFTGREAGVIRLTMELLSENRLRIEVIDDGTGLPDTLDWPNGGGLGSRIVRQVSGGLEATVDVTSSAEDGTKVTVELDI